MKRPPTGQPPKNAKEYRKLVVTDLADLVLADCHKLTKAEGGGYARDLYLMDTDGVCLQIELRAKWQGKLKLVVC